MLYKNLAAQFAGAKHSRLDKQQNDLYLFFKMYVNMQAKLTLRIDETLVEEAKA
jgi:hypothetical protein